MRFLIVIISIALSVRLAADEGAIVRPEVTSELIRASELEDQGYLRQAEQMLLKVIRETEPTGGLELALALNNLAVLYTSEVRYGDAEKYFQRALRTLERVNGEAAEQLAGKIKVGLAALYIESRRDKEAAKLDLPSVLKNSQSPEDKARVKVAIGSLAMLRNDIDTAERVYSEALTFWNAAAPGRTRDSSIGTLLNNLGVIALRKQQGEAARDLLEQSFAMWEKTLGADSPIMIKSMGNVAAVYSSLKQHDEAASWLGRSWTTGRRTLGDLHPLTVAVQFAYADALKKAGRKSEASEVRRYASDARRMSRSPSMSDYVVDYRDMINSHRR